MMQSKHMYGPTTPGLAWFLTANEMFEKHSWWCCYKNPSSAIS